MLEDGVLDGRIFLMPIGPRGDRAPGARLRADTRGCAVRVRQELATPDHQCVSVGETVGIDVSDGAKCWSEWQDLNLRPPRPERGVPPRSTND